MPQENNCPICGSEVIGRAKCPKIESYCGNGHTWHYNYNKEKQVREIHNGHAPHHDFRICDCEVIGEIDAKRVFDKSSVFTAYSDESYFQANGHENDSLWIALVNQSDPDMRAKIVLPRDKVIDFIEFLQAQVK